MEFEIFGYTVKVKNDTSKEDKFVNQLKEAYECGGKLAAKELCMNTKDKFAYVAHRILSEMM